MDIILVPGFWLDASSWDAVTPDLLRAGHRVHALTLPGMESPDSDRAGITLDDHVRAVVAAVDAVDPNTPGLVCVGHSGGAAMVHAAVDARPERITRAIYVDSVPLGAGRCINDALPQVDCEIPLPDWSVFDPPDLVDLDEQLRAAMRARAIPTPVRVATDAQHLTDERRYDVPITIIACEFTAANLQQWQGDPSLAELGRIREVAVVDLPTGHWPQFTRPRDLAQAILAAVG